MQQSIVDEPSKGYINFDNVSSGIGQLFNIAGKAGVTTQIIETSINQTIKDKKNYPDVSPDEIKRLSIAEVMTARAIAIKRTTARPVYTEGTQKVGETQVETNARVTEQQKVRKVIKKEN